MGQAISTGLQMVEQRKATYRTNGVSYYRPWVLLITDGGPTDEWQSAAAQVKQGEAAKSLAFFSVGVEGSDFGILGQIATRAPIKLKGVNFREMFLWLSSSMKSVSQSSPGDKLTVPPPTGWGDI
jgi:uncharacterized protein YegL